MQKTKFNRPPLASLACVNEFCDLYGRSGRLPKVKFRIPRSLTHIQVIKNRSGKRPQSVTIRYRHGIKKRAVDEQLGVELEVGVESGRGLTLEQAVALL